MTLKLAVGDRSLRGADTLLGSFFFEPLQNAYLGVNIGPVAVRARAANCHHPQSSRRSCSATDTMMPIVGRLAFGMSADALARMEPATEML
jgi:hypothetical protein